MQFNGLYYPEGPGNATTLSWTVYTNNIIEDVKKVYTYKTKAISPFQITYVYSVFYLVSVNPTYGKHYTYIISKLDQADLTSNLGLHYFSSYG